MTDSREEGKEVSACGAADVPVNWYKRAAGTLRKPCELLHGLSLLTS